MAHQKTTSRRVAKTASKILRSGKRFSRASKSAAGSALSQKHGRKRGR